LDRTHLLHDGGANPALLVSRDALNFGLIQTMVAIILMVGFVALVAAWTSGGPRTRS
jgi:hypothetical protein